MAASARLFAHAGASRLINDYFAPDRRRIYYAGMAQTSLAQSDRLRTAVLTAVMLALLAAALAAAHLLTEARTRSRWQSLTWNMTRVESLELPVPTQWRVNTRATRNPLLGAQSQFISGNGVHLLVAELRPGGLSREPLDVLNLAVSLVLAPQQRRHFEAIAPAKLFHAPPLSGIRVLALSGDEGARTNHALSVFTEDGRLYWVIALSRTLPADEPLKRQNLFDDALLSRLCEQAVDHRRRDAGAKDFTDSGLRGTDDLSRLSVPMKPRVNVDRSPGDPIDLLALAERAAVRHVRVRGTLDAGADDPADPLHPGRVLADMFRQATGREPDAGDRWHGPLAAPDGKQYQAWRLIFHSGGSADPTPTSRRTATSQVLYYIRGDSGLALLAQARVAREAEQALAKLAGELAASIAPIVARDDFAIVRKRGIALAEQIYRHAAASLKPTERYYLLEQDHQAVGFAVERIVPQTSGNLRWRGHASVVAGAGRGASQMQWAASDDASLFWWTQTPAGVEEDQVVALHLNGRRDELTLNAVHTDASEHELWSVPRPASYISPMAADYWPTTDEGAPGADPALLWFSDGASRPLPYLATAAVEDGQRRVFLRPLLGLDADILTVDDAGKVQVRYHVFRRSTVQGGLPDSGISIRLAPREELHQRLPESAARLMRLQQDP